MSQQMRSPPRLHTSQLSLWIKMETEESSDLERSRPFLEPDLGVDLGDGKAFLCDCEDFG